ncbi:hypothetical protein ES703_85765 [subsurface metagenome]
MTLFGRIRQFAKPVGQFHAAGIDLKPLGDTRIARFRACKCRLRRRIFEQHGEPSLPQMGLDVLDQHLAENVRPGVVIGNAHTILCGRRQRRAIAFAAMNRRNQVDAREALEGGCHGQKLGFGEGIAMPATEREISDAGGLRRMRNHHDGVSHDRFVRSIGAIPFQDGEFGQMQIVALAVAEDAREFENPRLAGGKQFFARELGRGAQVTADAAAIGARKFGARRVQVRLIAGRYLQDAGLDFEKSLLVKPGPDGARDLATRQQERPPVDMPRRRPPGRWLVVGRHQRRPPAADRVRSMKTTSDAIDIARFSHTRTWDWVCSGAFMVKD